VSERYTWGGQGDRFDSSWIWAGDPTERGWTDRDGVRWAKPPFGMPEPQTRIAFTRPKRSLIGRFIRRIRGAK
jgi:hypothetical protein